MLIDLTGHATLNKHVILNHKAEPLTAGLGRCRVWATLLLITFNFVFVKDYSVAKETTNHYRQWAFIQLNDLEQFYCLDELNYKESRWNPKAKNGTTKSVTILLPRKLSIRKKQAESSSIDAGSNVEIGRVGSVGEY